VELRASHEHQLEALLRGATFCDVRVVRESRQISFDSLEDYWAAMEAGVGLSGASATAPRCPPMTGGPYAKR
jgi:hypothetical protein